MFAKIFNYLQDKQIIDPTSLVSSNVSEGIFAPQTITKITYVPVVPPVIPVQPNNIQSDNEPIVVFSTSTIQKVIIPIITTPTAPIVSDSIVSDNDQLLTFIPVPIVKK